MDNQAAPRSRDTSVRPYPDCLDPSLLFLSLPPPWTWTRREDIVPEMSFFFVELTPR